MIKSLLKSCPIKYENYNENNNSEKLSDYVLAKYLPDDRKIVVKKDLPFEQFFIHFSTALAMAMLDRGGDFKTNVRLSFNDRKTNLNCNCIVVGGPGTGKTFHYVLPNVIKCTGESMVVCDPKGSTLKNAGKILKKNGYRVKVLDLKTPELSWGYNPFEYIRNEDDIYKMVELIFTANTPKDTRAQDPFFDDNAKFLFLACCYYLYYKAPKEEQNLPFVLEMINFLELRDDDFNYISPFDELFLELQQEEPHNIAVDYYLKFRQAKGRTAMSVVSSLVAKIGKYSLNSVKQISVHDELELNKLYV